MWFLLAIVALLALAGCGRARRGGGGARDLGTPTDSGGLDLGSIDAGSIDAGSGVDLGGGGFDARVDFGGGGVGTEGALRLSEGSVGLLEVFHAGVWGTVCNDLFDGSSAGPTVACRQLGFASGMYVTPEVPGVGEIHMDGVMCAGTEARLVDCPFNGFGVNDCTHSEDVGLDCSSGAP